jgi:hypothetical protein
MGIIYALSNVAGATFQDLLNANTGFAVIFHRTGGTPTIELWEFASDDSDVYSASLDTMYYFTIHRDATNLQLFIYSDTNRTVLLDTLTVARVTDSRYINCYGSRETGFFGARWITYDVYNLILEEAVSVEPWTKTSTTSTLYTKNGVPSVSYTKAGIPSTSWTNVGQVT